MSGTNHVAGGIVFTGIFCSFWNVNVLSSPLLLSLTALFSLLPGVLLANRQNPTLRNGC
jgi:inner membrane protein